jgi:hypothetical protein
MNFTYGMNVMKVLYRIELLAVLGAEDGGEVTAPGGVHVDVEGEPLLFELLPQLQDFLKVVHSSLLYVPTTFNKAIFK